MVPGQFQHFCFLVLHHKIEVQLDIEGPAKKSRVMSVVQMQLGIYLPALIACSSFLRLCYTFLILFPKNANIIFTSDMIMHLVLTLFS